MNDDGPDPTPAVLAEVERWIGAYCRRCGRAVCGHEVMMSFVLGFKGAPHCAPCLARGLAREAAEFTAEVRGRIGRRDCWQAGWRRASALEGRPDDGPLPCLPDGGGATAAAAARDDAHATATASAATIAAEWDAGDLGCGDLVLELRTRLKPLAAGALFKLTARDPGAPQDLPAWCGLTGHRLFRADPPTYLIQRRKE